MENATTQDCLVIGAGPIGLAAAIALRQCGFSVALAGRLPVNDPARPDMRTAALFEGSLRFLQRIGAWEALATRAVAIRGIRIVDASGGLLKAPEVTFRNEAAPDSMLDEAGGGDAVLGYNVANPDLVAALAGLVGRAELGGTARAGADRGAPDAIGADVTVLETDERCVRATLADGRTIEARCAIGADGRHSIARQAAGIGHRQWPEPERQTAVTSGQAALTLHFSHTIDHGGLSTEFHRPDGPCTTVPLGPFRSSLVWMDRAEAVARRMALDEAAFAKELEEALQGLLGPVRDLTPRRSFPLSSLIADRFAANRVFLAGEAGHAFPPIGAQGLNLGLRDVAELADCLSAARDAGADIGGDGATEAYHKARRTDVRLRTYGVDLFNRSLASRPLSRPLALLRGAMMHTTKAVPAWRRFLTGRGLSPPGAWPSLMRE